ncbi:MAG: phage holin family protein [Gemmatimonadaceae bacterium]
MADRMPNGSVGAVDAGVIMPLNAARLDGRSARHDSNGRETPADPSLGELVRDLSRNAETLVRLELALAKAEAREAGAHVARSAVVFGMAASLTVVGLVALSAAVVLTLGQVLGERYGLAALMVAGVVLVSAAVVSRRALRDLRRLPFDQTLASLREDSRWVAREAKELKQELTTSPEKSTSPF